MNITIEYINIIYQSRKLHYNAPYFDLCVRTQLFQRKCIVLEIQSGRVIIEKLTVAQLFTISPNFLYP